MVVVQLGASSDALWHPAELQQPVLACSVPAAQCVPINGVAFQDCAMGQVLAPSYVLWGARGGALLAQHGRPSCYQVDTGWAG